MLKGILERGEHSLFGVARDSGVPLSSLTRFVSGERDLKLATLDQLADVLGLKLVETGRDRVKPSKSLRPNSEGRHRAARLGDAPPLSAANLDELAETTSDGRDSMVAEAATPPESFR